MLALLTLVAPRGASAQSNVASDSLAAFPSPRARAWQVGFVRPDRLEHMSLSFVLTSACILATRDRRLAAGTVLSLGVAKELWDRRGASGFDAVDLAAGATGVGLAVACVRARGR